MMEVSDLRESLIRATRYVRVVMRCLGGVRDHPETSERATSLLCDLLDILYRIKDQLHWTDEKWVFHPLRVQGLHELVLLFESTLRLIETHLHPGGVGVRDPRKHVLEQTIIPRLEQYKVILILSTQPDSEERLVTDTDIRTCLRQYNQLEPVCQPDMQYEDDVIGSTDRMSSENFITLSDLCNRRQRGTCQWIFGNQKYRRWLHGSFRTLYCLGTAGVGKTFLSSAVIESLQKTFTSPDVAIVFIFGHKGKQKEMGSPALLQNVLAQLIYRRRRLSYPTKALYNFESVSTAKASSKAYQNVIRAEMNRFSKVFLVVDGLDTFDDRDRLLNRLQKLPEHAQLFITLRESKQLDKINYISVSSPTEEIEAYVAVRLRQDAALAHLSDNGPSGFTLQKDVIRYIVEKAHGIFLLAQLHLDLLASYNDRALAHSALFHLPESLVEAYAEIMKRVLSNYPNARRFLYWILYALRPLTVAELKVATTQNEEVGGANTDLGSFETQILNQTVGLTAIDAITGTVNLVHSTAIDSLHRMASASVIFSSAQKEISETCLTLLSADEVVDDCYASKCDIHRSSTDTLVSYAAAYWGYHARDAAEEEQTIQVLITTFLNKLSWRRPFTMDYGLATEHDFPEELGIGKYPEYWNPLHVLAYFGIICRAKRLLEQGVDIDTHANRLGVTPLLCAAYRGNEEMIELLLDHGANINAQTESGDTALHLAAIKGRRKTIKVLLARGIDTRIVNKAGASALQRTVGTLYDEATIPLLIRGKSDVNARNTMTGDTSLHLAVAFRRPRILLFLLDKNANINAFNDDRLTPLQLAAQLNNCEALILLLERGANVDARAQGDVTALHVSAEADNWVAFDLLLAGGADINAWDRVGNTLLHKQAAEPLGVGIASKLLDQGANLEARNSKGNTPLQSAALAGNKTMFLFLLERGANVAVETPKGENMLHITPPRDEHFLGIHQILLEKGLSVAATSSQGWTPLQQTCLQGTGSSDTTLDKSCEYLELLLSHGANINAMAESGEMESALHLATRAPVPRPSYVSLLLRHGADVNAKTKEGKTPLHLAAERGRESIFRILLEHGTDSLIKAPCSELKAGSSHAMGKSSGMTAFDLAKKNPLGALWFDDEGTLWPPATLSRRGSIATTIDDMSEIEDEVDQSETETGESTLVGE